MNKEKLQRKKSNLLLILGGIFITNALLAEMLGPKIFSLEKSLGLEPFGWTIFGEILNFDLSSGVILWPFVFITTDVINEYFGYSGVRKISLLTVVLIIYMFLISLWITELEPANFWLNIPENKIDNDGKPFDINYAFTKIFTQSRAIIVASVIAFLIGQLLDVLVFRKLRSITGKKFVWLRATGSTLFSQLVDSFVVLYVAFYLLGNWELKYVLAVGSMNYIYKFTIAIGITPLIYLSHWLIEKYLGKENAEAIADNADGAELI